MNDFIGSAFLLGLFAIGTGFSMQSTTSHKSFAKTPKAIIFDIDGTLADSWKLGYEATQVVLKNNGISLIDEATYHECTKVVGREDRFVEHVGEDKCTVGEEKQTIGAAISCNASTMQ